MDFEITYSAEILLNEVVTKEDVEQYRLAWIKESEDGGVAYMTEQARLSVKNLSEQLIRRVIYNNICKDNNHLSGTQKDIIDTIKQKAKGMGLVCRTKQVLVYVDAINFRASGSFESGKRR